MTAPSSRPDQPDKRPIDDQHGNSAESAENDLPEDSLAYPPTVNTSSREILRLAIPALGALVIEPLLLLADAAIVGRIGTIPLAALGIATTVLATIVGVFVFLAYGTTAAVARHLGAGDLKAALTQGVDGIWLAILLGIPTALISYICAPNIVNAFAVEPAVSEQAVTYLRASLPGIPAMLVLLAATGVLRGLQDTRTPLAVFAGGAILNIPLSLLLVHVMDLGIAGAGLGTAVSQLAMAVAISAIVVRGARQQGASLRPDRAGILAAGRSNVPLFVRTVALRGALVLTTAAAATTGAVGLAAHQLVFTWWSALALVLDSIAIAAQAITGRYLGAGDLVGTRAATNLMIRWGLGMGALLGLVLLLISPALGPLFVDDPAVWAAMQPAMVIAALTQVISGYVFVLDGVLIGAGDGRYLAIAGVVQLVLYAPLTFAVRAFAPDGAAGLTWLWLAFAVGFMSARAVLLGRRARGTAWMVTGAGSSALG